MNPDMKINLLRSKLFAVSLIGGLSLAVYGSSPMILPVTDKPTALCSTNWREQIPTRTSGVDAEKGLYKQIIAAPVPVVFRWADFQQKSYTLQISLKSDFSESCNYSTAQCSAEVYNLFRNKKYFCRVLSKDNKVLAAGTFLTADDTRWIKLPEPDKAPVNFRDFGGFVTANGQQVRQGMLYRGADLAAWRKVSKSNWQYLSDTLKIKSEVDLRYPKQVKDKLNSRLGKSVKYFFRPVNAYNSFTPEQNDLFRDTIKLFADKDNYPIYLHCSGGVDRTGEIAFLINGLLGVPAEKLFEDYEVSSLSIFPRSRDLPYFKKWRQKIASFAPAGANEQKQIECYLLAIGVTRDEIKSIRNILLENK